MAMVNDFGVRDPYNQIAIKVLRVGGGGGNAVDYMASADLRGVQFAAVDTDEMVLGRPVGRLAPSRQREPPSPLCSMDCRSVMQKRYWCASLAMKPYCSMKCSMFMRGLKTPPVRMQK